MTAFAGICVLDENGIREHLLEEMGDVSEERRKQGERRTIGRLEGHLKGFLRRLIYQFDRILDHLPSQHHIVSRNQFQLKLHCSDTTKSCLPPCVRERLVEDQT